MTDRTDSLPTAPRRTARAWISDRWGIICGAVAGLSMATGIVTVLATRF